MSNPIYMFYGTNPSEYVLSPLYNYMKKLSFDCLEIKDPEFDSVYEHLKKLKNKDVVFITSAHLFLDHYYYRKQNDNKDMIQALEIIDYLNPVKKIYYPHDLTEPIHQEIKWLGIFDMLLSPVPYFKHMNRYLEVIEVGWIKKEFSLNLINESKPPKAVLFLSHLVMFMRLGFEVMYSFIKPLLNLGVRVKLPEWPGVEEFEHKLKRLGVFVYPSSSNIFKVMEENEIILSNSTSSVNLEAALSGKQTLNLIDNIWPVSRQIELFNGIQNIDILTVEQATTKVKLLLNGEKTVISSPDILLPFNFSEAVANIIR